MKNNYIENMKNLNDVIENLEVGLKMGDDKVYNLLIIYHLLAIHQHLEQLVYKNEKVQT